MDDLRWILALVGAVIVVAIYFSSRFEREEWKRDRGMGPEHNRPSKAAHRAPQNIKLGDKGPVSNTAKPVERKDPIISEEMPAIKAEVDPVSGSTQPQEPTPNLKQEPNDKPVPAKPKMATSPSEVAESNASWHGVVDSAKEPLIEDEIVSIEIPEELSSLGEELKSETKLKFKPELEEPVQQELALGIEPLVLVLTIMARDDGQFIGNEIKQVLEDTGLKHGEMDIFHLHMPEKKHAIFSVASVIEPGIFDLDTIKEYKTPGLSLFCQLPGSIPGAVAFNMLLQKARSITEKLGGQLCDDKRNLLTEQALSHYRDRIEEFERELVLARKRHV